MFFKIFYFIFYNFNEKTKNIIDVSYTPGLNLRKSITKCHGVINEN
jgi:hypothetical protein